MKKLIIALIALSALANADVYVNGYYKSNGTYVKGHYRTSPNSIIEDNYSYKKKNNYNYNYNNSYNNNYKYNSRPKGTGARLFID